MGDAQVVTEGSGCWGQPMTATVENGSPDERTGDQTTEMGRADGAIFGCQVPVTT
jgi:hypothetical protein